MLDDDDSKVRRNLVVYSTAIIAAWFLGVSIQSLSKEFLPSSASFTTIPIYKIVLLQVAVQIYLSLRYRFSKYATDELDSFKQETAALFKIKAEKYIRRKVRNFRDNLTDKIFNPTLQGYVKDEEEDRIGFGKNNKLVSMQIDQIAFKTPWSGDIKISKELKTDDGGDISRSGGNILQFELVGKDKIYIKAFSIIHVILYTRGSINFLSPYFLSLSAFIIELQHLKDAW